MAAKTIYCAQAFWLRDGVLRGGRVHQFLNEERARAGGAALFTGAHGVAVFSVEGYPDIDLWEAPVILITHGAVPGSGGGPIDALDTREACGVSALLRYPHNARRHSGGNP